MIARLSHTTISPSQRTGTLPSDGANSSPSRRFSQSASNIGTKPVRDHYQELVSASMSETVVDELEAIEVDEQHG